MHLVINSEYYYSYFNVITIRSGEQSSACVAIGWMFIHLSSVKNQVNSGIIGARKGYLHKSLLATINDTYQIVLGWRVMWGRLIRPNCGEIFYPGSER